MLSVVLAGCYTLRPVGTAAPAPGAEVALNVNDLGRVALGGTIGPEISQVEGRLVSRENDEYVLAVKAIRFLRGGEQVWSGERVRINAAQVSGVYERRFSGGRTATLAAVTVSSAVAFFATRSLIGLGSEPGPDKRPPDPGSSLTRPPAGTRP